MPIREAQVAGTFYPSKKESLIKTIQNFNVAELQTDLQNITCIIAPHAGYIYSGRIAAAAYNYIKNKNFDTVIVISPSHHDYFTGCSTIYENYLTPLGEISTYKAFVEKLTTQSELVTISKLGHGAEHALEVHLPFLQTALNDFKHVPIVMGRQNIETAQVLAEDLFKLIDNEYSDQKFLVVCSSDLSHFYNIEKARILDETIKEDIEAFNADKLNSDIISKKGEACGYGPVLSGMILSRMMGANNSKVIAYGTSGDVNNDYSSVVGYLSAILYKN
jgi:MEMO1 family protein